VTALRLEDAQDRASRRPKITKKLLVTCAVVAILAGAVSYIGPHTYESRVLLLLESSGDNGVLSLLQGADFPAISSMAALSGKQPGQAYAEILQSRSLLTRLLQLPRPSKASETYFGSFAPQAGTPEKRMEKAVKRLRSSIEADFNPRSETLSIKVTNDDRVLASEVANQLSLELSDFNSKTRRTRASDASIFVRARLEEASGDLDRAEGALASFRSANARIGNAPLLLLQEKRLERRVLLAEQIHTLLTREYEMARIQEKKETPVFTVVDEAIPSVRPAGLHPVIAAGVAAIVTGVAALFIAAAYSLRRA